MSAPIPVAVVGCGTIAPAHARSYRDSGRTELVGVADLQLDRAAAFAAEYGAPRHYRDVYELLADCSPRLVSVCTPPGSHAEVAIAALRAGSSVLLEKPPCLNLAEFDAIAAAAADSSGEAYVVFQHRHGSGARRARALIDAGAFGAPRLALCETVWFRPDSYFDPDWRGTWTGEGGGPTLGHGIHQIDLLLHLFGDWTELTAVAARVARPVEFEDVSLAAVRFATGAVGSIVNSLLSPREESQLRFDFTDGTLEVTHLYGYSDADWRYTARVSDAAGAAAWSDPGGGGPDRSAAAGDPWSASAGASVSSNHAAEISPLLAALAGDGDPDGLTRLADTRATMEVVTAIYASALTGTTVRRDQLRPGHPFWTDLAGGRDLAAITAAMVR